MSGVYDSPSQQIINWLRSLFLADAELQDLSWHPFPPEHYATLSTPFALIYSASKEHNQHAFQDHYEYVQTIIIQAGTVVSENTDEERLVHYWENRIEDLIIENQQPQAGNKDIPSQLTVQSTRVIRSEYTPFLNDENQPLDFLQMQIDVMYTRVVTT